MQLVDALHHVLNSTILVNARPEYHVLRHWKNNEDMNLLVLVEDEC